ncbi:hypothetical protein EVAR_24397_1 [Eumeta japonica]|uniref:Uncharacterized protein n=1 Tax=Eumeta variegata TaxID=151549 RepID=A0A4C1VTF6_EUMVA|nr:hypothetical protein EVAR_24397_1 [Eumeta japonica]
MPSFFFDDFNCKNFRWDYPVVNYNGNEITRLDNKLNFDIKASTTSTYCLGNPSNRPSTLDIAVIKRVTFKPYRDKPSSGLIENGPSAGGSPNPTIKISD